MRLASQITWISHLPPTPSGGGTYAVNYRAQEALAARFEVVAAEPIPIRGDLVPALVSKVRRRLFGLPGSFACFSEARLKANAEAVRSRLGDGRGVAFLRGVTPWSAWEADRPYFCYTDVGFRTFFENTFDSKDFESADLARIFAAERRFFERAEAVFFESRWGMEETKHAYGLEGANFVAAGRGGNLPVPEADRWDGRSRRLVTMAKHFRQKGGDLVHEAYAALKPDFPELSWSILGGEPDFDWRAVPGVRYEGFLDPGKAEELARMEEILGEAFLLVHPTREDTNPLVITEAASFGCPCVSVDRFAIPELVRNGETGILLPPAPTAAELAGEIRSLLEDAERYRRMRIRARDLALAEFGWDAVAERMGERLRRVF